jgi:Mycothiol maleylpyruvate isomerase N-terminal domain
MAAISDTLCAAYAAVTELMTDRTDRDFDRPTRCEGLAVGPLLAHLLLDAQRALMAFATPAEPPADRDFVTYWTDFPAHTGPRPDPDPSAAFITRVATAYAHPAEGLVRHWHDTAEAAGRAALAAPRDGYIETQGHVLAVPDFIATLVFEAAIHHLDLSLELSGKAPPAAALDLVARTLDGLADADPRAATGWDDRTYALKGTGRLPIARDENAILGDAAVRFPLMG